MTKRMEFFHPFFILTLFLFVGIPSFSQFSKNQLTEKEILNIQKEIFDFNFVSAQTKLSKASNSNVKIYLENTIDVLQILVTDNELLLDSLSEYERIRSEQLRNSDSNLIYRAELHYQWALVKLFYGHEGSGALSLKKSYNLLQKSRKRYPNNPLNNKLDGLYNSLLGNAPNKYKWLLEFLGFQGDVKEGKNLLGVDDGAERLFSIEKRLLLELLNVKLFENSFEYHISDKNATTLEHLSNITLLINQKKYSLAADEFSLIEKKPDLPFYKHIQAQLDFYAGRYNSCILNSLLFQKATMGSTYLKYSNLLVFYSNIMLDRKKEKLLDGVTRIIEKGDLRNSKDKFAQKIADNFRYSPIQIQLLKSRLYYDSGKNKLASLALDNVVSTDNLSIENTIEYSYRRARIFHSSGDLINAHLFYQKVWKTTTRNNTIKLDPFFAAMSCLELGRLYLDFKSYEGRVDKQLLMVKAKKCFQAAIDFKNHEYENDIEFKANLELKKLNSLK